MIPWWPVSTSSPLADCFCCLLCIFDWQANYSCEFNFVNCFAVGSLFCVAILWFRCYCEKCIKIEIFPLWCGVERVLLYKENYSTSLPRRTRCALWIDLQGLLCEEENSEFYDASGKNGTGSGLCQAQLYCCKKKNHQMRPVNMECVRIQKNRISFRLR